MTNIGMGHRYLTNEWLFGYNAFYDTAWDNHSQRWGVGVEAWRDFLKFSANGYRAISGWHKSQQHDDYDERPANGWDLRAEGWLPFMPQVGLNMMYERYYGDNVALSSFSQRQHNPTAMTAGLRFMPIPLINAGIDYRSGTQGLSETRLNLGLNWRLGEPLSKQLDPQNILSLHTLESSRRDLVSRNNVIVFDYRKQASITLILPTAIRGSEYSTYSFTPTVSATHGVSHLEFDDSALTAAKGKILSNTPSLVTLQLPSAQLGQGITLSAVAVDNKGNRSKPAFTQIWTQASEHALSLSADKTLLTPNGSDAAKLTLHIDDGAGQPLPNEAIELTTDGGTLSKTKGTTDRNGDFYTTLTSTSAGVFHVSAIDGGQKITHPGITFQEEQLNVQLTPMKSTALADGFDAIEYQLTAQHADGSAAKGQVQWSTSLGSLSASAANLDSHGKASVKLSSTKTGTALLQATVGSQTTPAPEVQFTEVFYYFLQMPPQARVGEPVMVQVWGAVDGEGNPLQGEVVAWSSTGGQLSQTSTVLDSNGETSIRFTADAPGIWYVSTTLRGTPLRASIQVTW